MALDQIGNVSKIAGKRILFTLGMLAIYRIGIFVTTPGVNRIEMQNLIASGGSGSFLGLFNMFSGGALETFYFCNSRLRKTMSNNNHFFRNLTFT